MKKIEILGTGCAKCKRVEKNALEAVSQLGIEAKVTKVEDIGEIVNRGVMMTPALFIDGIAKAVGRIPSVEEIKAMLQE